MTDCLNGVTHGPVHILIGGNWGEGSTFSDNRDISFLQGMNKLLFFKSLWRTGFTRCPTSCAAGEGVGDESGDGNESENGTGDENDGSTSTISNAATTTKAAKATTSAPCACKVPDQYIDTYGAQGILERAGIWDQLEPSLLKGDASEATVLAALRAIEDPAGVGEMFSSGAPYDPTFWPVHGQVERLMGLKRVRLAEGYVSSKGFAEAWGFAAKDKRYLAGRCDWSGR
jgi:hypothetical protein